MRLPVLVSNVCCLKLKQTGKKRSRITVAQQPGTVCFFSYLNVIDKVEKEHGLEYGTRRKGKADFKIRNKAIVRIWKDYNVSKAEIGRLFKLHKSTVSKILKDI